MTRDSGSRATALRHVVAQPEGRQNGGFSRIAQPFSFLLSLYHQYKYKRHDKVWATASRQPAFVASRSSRLRRLAPSGINQALGALLKPLRERRARKRLAEIVAQTRDSYECRRYRDRRAAALKGLGK